MVKEDIVIHRYELNVFGVCHGHRVTALADYFDPVKKNIKIVKRL
jgi:hypothetical protein